MSPSAPVLGVLRGSHVPVGSLGLSLRKADTKTVVHTRLAPKKVNNLLRKRIHVTLTQISLTIQTDLGTCPPSNVISRPPKALVTIWPSPSVDTHSALQVAAISSASGTLVVRD